MINRAMLRLMSRTQLGTVGFYGVKWLIRLAMLLIVPQRRDPRVATAWLMLIFMFPVGGLLLYMVFGTRRQAKVRLERQDGLRETINERRDRLDNHTAVAMPALPANLAGVPALSKALSGIPVFGGNAAELLPVYEESIDRLIDDINHAERHVNVLYYIIADDSMGLRLSTALRRAAERGVTCRVLVDALGSRAYIPGLRRSLEGSTVELHEMLPLPRPRGLRSRADLRNHRKIAVIDGKIGYTGSQNIVDPQFKPGIVFQELVVRVEGPIVHQLQLAFVADWYLETGTLLADSELYPTMEKAGDVYAQVVASGTGFRMANNQRLFVELLYGARCRAVITTPYFVPDEPLSQAMQAAATRGVDVHLVVSATADQLLMGLAQPSYYAELLEAGVTIHQYEPRFLHAKHMSIDDDIAVIGSSNMDIRSSLLNSEISLVIYDRQVVAQMRALEADYLAHATALDAVAWMERSTSLKLVQSTGRLLSPLL